MQSASSPLYCNQNLQNTRAQEDFRCATTAKRTRLALPVRFSLFPYWYTIFYKDYAEVAPILHALAWYFLHEELLRAIDNQFMLGLRILITTTLAPILRASPGVFLSIGQGTKWYTYNDIKYSSGYNVTLDTPPVHIPVNVKTSSIILSQMPEEDDGNQSSEFGYSAR
ncbi:uncharacterized protein BDR25DRAFT_313558 [Lindgomyces ingoldianus]|uniref:Uncharacterized protein n=1 Tax=Lindgomyces ingoldianus TaxID=673940 RepID=A0ACB6QX70_9PLEO|nr:uncharacterized protein BDR25DRAFT_313558 [Lindgomyces ingoldianus]KAF2471624.1 hypothetical protein BDR25DRAFT_313558 [Lindgomyces ingoldianus]